MGLFSRKHLGNESPDESTLDRAKLKREAITKLRRAQDLKRRSSAVVADLNEHGETNHYAARIREAYGIPT